MAENVSEQVKKIDEQIEQLKARRQAVISRDKERSRKERTRRLIQNGALAEQYLNCTNISPKDFENLLKNITSIDAVKKILFVPEND